MRDSIMEKGYLNSKLVPLEEIFTVLDGEKKQIYEVVRIIEGKPLFLEEHVDRMNKSIKLINLERIFKYSEIEDIIYMLIDEYNITENNVKIAYFENSEEHVVAYFTKSKYPSEEKHKDGYKTVLIYEEREIPNAKIVNNELRSLINNILESEGADECIYVSENGEILEGSRTNVFFIKGNTVLTAPDEGVLLGTTRKKILDICIKERIALQKRTLMIEELTFFDAAFMTGTSIDVMPINKIGEIELKSSKNRIVEIIREEYTRAMRHNIRINL
jgi:branched-chain amino acid aminotransferase